MRKLLLAVAFAPLIAFAAIEDWNYTPYVSYNTYKPSPFAIIRQGGNFRLLQTLWEKPQSLKNLEKSGFDFSDVDTVLLLNQGMIYPSDGKYRSAVPFIDSVAIADIREKARFLAQNIVEDTRPEMNSFMATLDAAGVCESAFPLVHSLVFDGITWDHLDVSHESATICQTDSMSWNGLFYFFRPEAPDIYGTNGISLGDKGFLKFSWGDSSNAYLCTAFIKTNIRRALINYLNGEELTPEMVRDCEEYGVIDENGKLRLPVLDGTDAISLSADLWAKAVASSFMRHFNVGDIAAAVGLSPENEAALKVILYHEVLFEVDRILDEQGHLKLPEILKVAAPEDKKATATVAYIKL